MRHETTNRCGPRPGGSRAARAFTLVELVTAASLMTVMMLGVVEIFHVVTASAAEAKGMQFAHQQLRGFFDRLNTDLRGLPREGYIKMVTASPSAPVADGTGYSSDSLSFVSVGWWRGLWDPDPEEGGTAAEILYTTNVETPNDFLVFGSGPNRRDLDHRRGVLGRSIWVMNGSPGTGVADRSDNSPARYLGELYAHASTGRQSVSKIAVYPPPGRIFTPGSYSADAPSLKKVMATCASEFFVEYWEPNPSEDGGSWKHLPKIFAWTSNRRPGAVRVTVAVHDPDDKKPLPPDHSRFRGYVLQETFYIGDP